MTTDTRAADASGHGSGGPEAPAARVAVRSLGGTIAMTTSANGSGAAPSLGADALITAIPELAGVATVDARTVLTIPGASLDIPQLLALHAELEQACVDGADGSVVIQGTDTLEESAYLLDLLWTRPEPLVITGAMRTADTVGADGPANLLAAVTVAVSPDSVRRGCLLVMSDEIHHARSVRKLHTANVGAFGSPSTGPAGVVHEGHVIFHAPPGVRKAPLVPRTTEGARVAIVRVALGGDTVLLDAAVESYDGIVVEALGGGHVPFWWFEPLLKAAARMPVILASRTGNGPLLESTYDFPGSEKRLLAGGLISAGSLDGLKARILLTLVLMTATDGTECEQLFTERAGANQRVTPEYQF